MKRKTLLLHEVLTQDDQQKVSLVFPTRLGFDKTKGDALGNGSQTFSALE
jgi:hypothetical protein